jgi:hypothetical protein
MIGRWMLLLLFSGRYIQLEWVETEQLSCGESTPKKVCSMSSFSFAPWPVLEVATSPGKACGTLRPLQRRLFAWSATLGKILTLDSLRKRHVTVIDRCYMCKKTGESVDLLLLHCDVAFALWSSLFSRFELS